MPLLRKTLKLSQEEFGKRIYVSQSLLTEIESGNRKVNNCTIQLIVSEYNANKDWILTGNGDMFSAPPSDIRKKRLLEIFNELDDMLQDYILLQSKELLKIQKRKSILIWIIKPALPRTTKRYLSFFRIVRRLFLSFDFSSGDTSCLCAMGEKLSG